MWWKEYPFLLACLKGKLNPQYQVSLSFYRSCNCVCVCCIGLGARLGKPFDHERLADSKGDSESRPGNENKEVFKSRILATRLDARSSCGLRASGRGEDDLVTLEAAPVTGEGHVSEGLGVQQPLKRGEHVGLVQCPAAKTKQPIKMAGIWPGPNNKYFPHFKSSLRKCDHFAELSDHRDRNVVSPVNQWSGTWHNEQHRALIKTI